MLKITLLCRQFLSPKVRLGGVDRGVSLNVDYSFFALLVYNLQPKFEENLHLHQKVKIYNLLQKFIKIYNFQINAFLPLLTFNQAILLIYRGKMPYIRNMSVPIESCLSHHLPRQLPTQKDQQYHQGKAGYAD